jgi:hypothetical protein
MAKKSLVRLTSSGAGRISDTLSDFDERPVDLFGFVFKARGVELNARRPLQTGRTKVLVTSRPPGRVLSGQASK